MCGTKFFIKLKLNDKSWSVEPQFFCNRGILYRYLPIALKADMFVGVHEEQK